MGHYIIVVKTGDLIGAGTDANVFVSLNGELGRQKFPLQSSLEQSRQCKYKKFSPNQTDTFHVTSDGNLGHFRSMTIWQDKKESNWYLDAIQIIDLHSDTVYHFPCAHWLAAKIGRKVYCTKYELIQNLDCHTKQTLLAPLITSISQPLTDTKQKVKISDRVVVIEPSEYKQSQITNNCSFTPIVAQTEMLVQGKKKKMKKMARAAQMGCTGGYGGGYGGYGGGYGMAGYGGGYGGYPRYGGGYGHGGAYPAYGYGYNQPYAYGGYGGGYGGYGGGYGGYGGYGGHGGYGHGFKGFSWSWSWSW